MSIGLYDLDMAQYERTPFNLELMKMATYYKNKNQIVLLAPKFAPERYSKFIVRKDYEDGNYPLEIGTMENLEYGGLAFTDNIYVPLDEKIERCVPDLFIYERWKHYFQKKKVHQDVYRRMQRAHHLRLSLDGRTIWSDYRKQIGDSNKKYVLMFHDYDLEKIDNSFELIKELLSELVPNGQGRVGMKFPTQVTSFDKILQWIELPAAINLFSLQYNGLLEDEAYIEFVSKLKNIVSANFSYLVTHKFSESTFIKDILPKVYRQILYSRSKGLIISLKYDNLFFSDPRWERVIGLINSFNTSLSSIRKPDIERKLKYDSMYSFAFRIKEKSRLPKDIFTKNEVRNLFQFVRMNNYELFKSFYECHIPILKGGIFQDDGSRSSQ